MTEDKGNPLTIAEINLEHFKNNGIEKLLKFHRLSKDNIPCEIIENAICDHILETVQFFVMGGEPYIYEDGVYKRDVDGNKMQRIIQNCIVPALNTANRIKRTYQLILIQDKHKEFYELNQYPKHYIPFKNGMYDVIAGVMLKNNPCYYSINQIPHEFHPNDEPHGENTEKFLRYAINNADDIKTIYEYIGLCMTRDNSIQKFMFLKGSRGTGKSQLIKIFEKVIGRDNISNVPLQRLEEKFYCIQLMGKMLNSCADIPSSALRTVNTIKLITGGDTLADSYKGKDIITFVPYCKLLFSANTIPVSLDEKSNAFFERLIIISMDNRPSVPDRELEQKLALETDYIIHEAVRGLKRVYDKNSITESDSSKSMVQELYNDCDTVTSFFFDKLQKDIDKSIKSTDLLTAYKKYCEENEREALSRNNLYKNLRNKGYGKVTIHGYEYFTGLDFKDTDFQEISSDDEEIFD